MKYEKTDPFEYADEAEKLIAEAVAEAEDTEAEEFLSQDTSDAEISDELDRRILDLMDKKPTKEIFRDKYYPKILSSAALVTFVTVCFAWVAMMSTFVKFPWNGTEPPSTDIPPEILESTEYRETLITGSEPPSHTEASKNTGPGRQPPEMTNPGGSVESSNSKPQGGTDPSQEDFSAPSDEKRVTYIVTQGTVDGVFVKVSINGYQSELLGKDFYVKSNEYFTVDVEVKNISASPIYRTVYEDCAKSAVPHVHGDILDLTFEGHGLCSSVIGFSCGKQAKTEILKSGESYRYQLRYAAGEAAASDFDLPGDGTDYPAGVKLYNKTFYNFYTRGSCKFQGSFELAYAKNENGKTVKFAIPLTLDVLYIAPEK